MDLTVIGNPVFILSRDLSYPFHVVKKTRVIKVHNCKYNIAYRIRQSVDFAMIGNPSCCRFYPLLVLEFVRKQVVMTSPRSSGFCLRGESVKCFEERLTSYCSVICKT